jgi:hypothetical protein
VETAVTLPANLVPPITVFWTNGRSVTASPFGFTPRVVAMLAEIFMVRLEAEGRLVQEVLPSSTSSFIPFSTRSQFTLKETNLKGEEAPSEPATARQ